MSSAKVERSENREKVINVAKELVSFSGYLLDRIFKTSYNHY
jgi:hypothetical protein